MAPDDDLVADPETVDIDGTDRSQETDWDIGADEVESAPAGVWYVDAAGSGDGRSWKSAFATIQQAIAAATDGQEIWVREGTYSLTPTTVITKQVALYGGFAGNERKKEKRDWVENPTVLSGSVLKLSGSGIVVDGFTFTSATSGSVTAQMQSSFSIQNCRFEGNRGSRGGAIFASWAQGTIVNCWFSANEVTRHGGAVYSEFSALSIVNSVFVSNRAGQAGYAISGGGAVYVSYGDVSVLNSTFFNNQTKFEANFGGAIHTTIPIRIENSIIWGDSENIGKFQVYSSDPAGNVVSFSNIEQPEFGALNSNGNISAPPFWVNAALGDFHLQSGSPGINSGSSIAGLPPTDYDGNPRVAGFAVDMGAFEYTD
jgi:hypothetical protein